LLPEVDEATLVTTDTMGRGSLRRAWNPGESQITVLKYFEPDHDDVDPAAVIQGRQHEKISGLKVRL
jgi:hypothetical protein